MKYQRQLYVLLLLLLLPGLARLAGGDDCQITIRLDRPAFTAFDFPDTGECISTNRPLNPDHPLRYKLYYRPSGAEEWAPPIVVPDRAFDTDFEIYLALPCSQTFEFRACSEDEGAEGCCSDPLEKTVSSSPPAPGFGCKR
ncbi:MAG: hypothetical protein GY847_01745 [Proteobacteria bacterium]|nr:hypothetical protein [Pseudomonadota bacterium]